jgi:hypothetical protein
MFEDEGIEMQKKVDAMNNFFATIQFITEDNNSS